jgi:cytochrome c-type biogenesis protein CcmH/NrfF
MLRRTSLIVVAVLVVIALVFAFGVVAERLGDWTDANPDKAPLSWTMWNVGLVAILVVTFLTWRRYRRSRTRTNDSASPAA